MTDPIVEDDTAPALKTLPAPLFVGRQEPVEPEEPVGPDLRIPVPVSGPDPLDDRVPDES